MLAIDSLRVIFDEQEQFQLPKEELAYILIDLGILPRLMKTIEVLYADSCEG